MCNCMASINWFSATLNTSRTALQRDTEEVCSKNIKPTQIVDCYLGKFKSHQTRPCSILVKFQCAIDATTILGNKT